MGDVQGCARTFERLLERIAFDPGRDRLWLVGDLVNRGPDSLAVLRRVRALGSAAQVVLGNHDLHLLARAAGVRGPEAGDTLDGVLAAPDRDDLVHWLAAWPLLFRESGFVLVHAGLLPAWSLAEAESRAREVEQALAGDLRQTLAMLSGKAPARWSERLSAADRLRFIVRAFTRLRLVDQAGHLAGGHKGPLETAPKGTLAWFDAHRRRPLDETVLCGHWAALGLRLRADVIALDSGCVWGGLLSAVRLEDRAVFQEPNAEGLSRTGT